MIAEASSRRKGVAYEALNLFMAYTVKHLVSIFLMHLAHDMSVADGSALFLVADSVRTAWPTLQALCLKASLSTHLRSFTGILGVCSL